MLPLPEPTQGRALSSRLLDNVRRRSSLFQLSSDQATGQVAYNAPRRVWLLSPAVRNPYAVSIGFHHIALSLLVLHGTLRAPRDPPLKSTIATSPHFSCDFLGKHGETRHMSTVMRLNHRPRCEHRAGT